jgi:hypothetical protein
MGAENTIPGYHPSFMRAKIGELAVIRDRQLFLYLPARAVNQSR